MRPTIEDLARMAALGGVVIPPADLERLLPLVAALYKDVEGLRVLPISAVEPAFTPEPRATEVPNASDGRNASGGQDGPRARAADRPGA